MNRNRSKRPAVPLLTACPDISDPEKLIEDLRSLIASGRLSNFGPRVRELEARLARLWSVPAYTVANASLGLELTIEALGLKGRAIVPSFTFFSTAHACRRAGLETVFADIDPKTYCLDPASVEALIDDSTALVVPVHTYGNLADVAYFESLRERGIAVVYDAAHAMGVGCRLGEPASFGDASVFSFHATKIVSAGEGGAVAATDPELGTRIARLANFGLSGETEVLEVGTNAKLSEVHALFALHGLDALASAVTRRLAVTGAYREALAGVDALRLPRAQAGVSPNGQFFPVRFDDGKTRERVFDALVSSEIYPRRYFSPPLHRLAAYRNAAKGDLSVTESVADTILCLPLHSAMGPADARTVARAIRRALAPRRTPLERRLSKGPRVPAP